LPATAPTTPAVTPEDATATNGGTGNTTPTPTPTPTVVPTVKPTVVKAWEPTDPNISMIKENLAKNGWNKWQDIDYKMFSAITVTRNGNKTKYYAEWIRNNTDSKKKYTIDFDSKWSVVTHKSNKIVASLKPQEDLFFVAKYNNINTKFSWSLYDMSSKDIQ